MIDFTQPIRAWMPIKVYPGYQPGLPDLIVGRLPPQRPGYKTWICETHDELAAVQKSLDQPIKMIGKAIDFMSGPDAVLGPASDGEKWIALYAPPDSGWPFVTIARFTRKIGREIGLARGIYSVEVDDSERVAYDRVAKLKRIAKMKRMALDVREDGARRQ